MPDAKFRITAKSEAATRVTVKARNFTMVVDEPPALGGEDKGANPVEFVLGALAGCLNVMGNLIAKEMGMKVNNLEFAIEGPLNPDKLFGKPTEDRAGFKEINVKVNIDSDADAETLAKWLEAIESRCPVSDNLGNPTPVKISLS